MEPSQQDYTDILVRCFNQGLDQIQVFERWSKHNELTPYADALEEWDDIVGDVWEEPDSLLLNPHSWINENPIYTDQKEKVSKILDKAFSKANLFLTRFQPLLEIYWRNK
jgi:dynein heavy chain